MTDAMMSLKTLVDKTPDADLLQEMIGFAAERLMELEVAGLTGAGYGEKSAERLVQRNGYRDRAGRCAPARWSSGFRNSGRAPTSPSFWAASGSLRRC